MTPGLGTWNTTDGDLQDLFGARRPRDITIQIVLSIALGTGAFLTFCILRPRWEGLYAARKKQNDEATALPELPRTLFGWIPALWRITDQQVLASAGLDAYVFLAFFKMAIKFLSFTLFFSVIVINPVHSRFPDTSKGKLKKNETIADDGDYELRRRNGPVLLDSNWHVSDSYSYWDFSHTDYLWMYLVFAYLFTGLAAYMIVSETRRVIEIRQEYLGSQTTVTDRTIRLSGIPPELRSETKIKEFVEELEIGSVESVTLCRNWKALDELMDKRMLTLRKLEEAWTVHLGQRRVERNLESLPISQPSPPEPYASDSERAQLLGNGGLITRRSTSPYNRSRPLVKIWYGRLKVWYRNVDAINFYEEKLRRLDDEIKTLRNKEFEPTPLAFVTMDSVASCQMAVQAVLDPSPLQLLANTNRVFPGFKDAIEYHKNIKSIIVTQLPTLLVSLLNVLVPYLYDWLANHQGMIGQGDVELSVISKNFFFVFFNFFVVFTVLGTASGFWGLLENIGEQLRDATKIANALALSLQGLLNFYTNFVILQGIGLFPFRLLEFGSVALYPITLMGAKTPRDYAELVQPPVFSYGFYLPQTILIFIICTVYSVLRSSWMVLLAGLIYFVIGHFVHKYQLLYAMDHRQHSTGRGWTMICDRVIVGLILFQLTMAGQLALKGAFWRAALLVPLTISTLWFWNVYTYSYKPLMRFIALKSLRRAERSDLVTPQVEQPTIDEERERGQRYVNPNLVMPLEDVWITDNSARALLNGQESPAEVINEVEDPPRKRFRRFFRRNRSG
ncbi:hypothetical protein UCDDS831_g05141 [Diplodia seriata]|uniref:Calcium permeable stress-gated cation channel 1 n=1 Tax=Diplodia seriata TaxID=420778 RepID=A0A0G2EC77_9PEZI|nr:hypothetical protein UCDDS831_g05141 [Diplodia seriata]